MKKKVLFFDIDGTLYDYRGQMPASAAKALTQARLRGHQLVVCSGRAKYQVYEELLRDFDGLICDAGAYVAKGNELIYEHFMPRETIQKIEAVFTQAGGFLSALTDNRMILSESAKQNLEKKFLGQGISQKMLQQVMGNYLISEELSHFTDIKKVLYENSDWSVAQVQDALRDCCDVTASSFEKAVEDSGEISVRGIDKSFGMKKYIEAQGLSREDTIAFGDGPNDVDMIAFAGTGVVMGNGRPELKAQADFVTKSVDEDGIAYALEKLGLI